MTSKIYQYWDLGKLIYHQATLVYNILIKFRVQNKKAEDIGTQCGITKPE
jgi:hypothetical protein